jgi:hypothetical protein
MFFDIGLETEGLYDIASLRCKLNGVGRRQPNYIAAHIQYSSILEREISQSGRTMIYMTRNPVDVLYSYSNYLENTAGHIHHKLFHEIGKREFLLAMIEGRCVRGINFRRFFDQVRTFDTWSDTPKALVFDYTKYFNNPTAIEQNFKEQLEEQTKKVMRVSISSVLGRGKTFFKGGNDKWRGDPIFLEIMNERLISTSNQSNGS